VQLTELISVALHCKSCISNTNKLCKTFYFTVATEYIPTTTNTKNLIFVTISPFLNLLSVRVENVIVYFHL